MGFWWLSRSPAGRAPTVLISNLGGRTVGDCAFEVEKLVAGAVPIHCCDAVVISNCRLGSGFE